jgi:hypothetical protein
MNDRPPSLARGSAASLLWTLIACSIALAAGVALALLGVAFLWV